jgi:hypothetical protein
MRQRAGYYRGSINHLSTLSHVLAAAPEANKPTLAGLAITNIKRVKSSTASVSRPLGARQMRALG